MTMCEKIEEDKCNQELVRKWCPKMCGECEGKKQTILNINLLEINKIHFRKQSIRMYFNYFENVL